MENETHATPLAISARQSARWLGWLGVIPFLGLALISGLDGPLWLAQALVVYGALILAFMAGTYWMSLITGQRLSVRPKLELIASNGLVLTGWLAVLMPVPLACLWLSGLFSIHLAMDAPWRMTTGPAWYRHMRLGISLTVIALLILGALTGFGLGWSRSA